MDGHKESLLFRENYLHAVHEDPIFDEFFRGLTCIKGCYNKKQRPMQPLVFLFQ